ncbi:hypothetical protein G647_10420 [Cladophialophora carrionii CBS 160.54]|uniref:Kinesin motor domain-containing protein n=1 Tax=Cladophialophora carrionii CBS 160.54 TaxID=1279043 RepID=V9DIV2_9EURO|nr:uncharacterized protein G647_10420 [Cladophialophora carrionii CBS 160.54]ETI26606.1 hypothetical protein G647_10420 [Cladophialophora carrionii CBS 160.54]
MRSRPPSDPFPDAMNEMMRSATRRLDLSEAPSHRFDYLTGADEAEGETHCAYFAYGLLAAHVRHGSQICFVADGESGTGKTHGTFKGRRSVARCAIGLALAAMKTAGRPGDLRIALTEWHAEASGPLRAMPHDRLRRHSSGPEYSLDPWTPTDARTFGETWYALKAKTGFDEWEVGDSFLPRALRHRKVATTSLNDESSRSHLVLSIHLPGDGVRSRDASIMMVDLAGSELGMEEDVRHRGDLESAFIHASRHAILRQLRAFAAGQVVAQDAKVGEPHELLARC